jgi:outer membrane biosynthesis protein TonB
MFAVKLLRRRFRALIGGLLLLCLALAGPATAAAPAPDAPPLAVTPEAPQAESAPTPAPAPARQAPVVQRAPVVTRTVVTPAPVVTRTVVKTREVPAKPAPVKKKPVAPVKPKPKPKPKPVFVARPHDRKPLPLATLIPSVEELDRGLLVLAGGGLAFVALGGAVVLLAARRELGELAQ